MNLPPFNPAKPFYSLVTNFAVQMLGFKEAMAMSHVVELRQMKEKILAAAREERAPFEIVASAGKPIDGFDLFYPYQAEARDQFPYNVNLPIDRLLTHTAAFEIVGPRPLKCLTQSDGLEYSAEEIAEVCKENTASQMKALTVSGGSLLIAAYEATKDASDKGPVWEFLRHCRNAAAHGGCFHLASKEPSRPASWKSLTIDSELQGSPLFDILSDKGLIGLGDAVLMLWDVEQLMP